MPRASAKCGPCQSATVRAALGARGRRRDQRQIGQFAWRQPRNLGMRERIARFGQGRTGEKAFQPMHEGGGCIQPAFPK